MNKYTLRMGGRTCERLEPGRVLAAGADAVHARASPVAPARDVAQARVDLAVLEVLLRHDALAAGGVDEVVERDGAGDAAVGGVLPFCGDGPAERVVVREDDGEGARLLEDAHAALFGVAEEDVVKVGAGLCGVMLIGAGAGVQRWGLTYDVPRSVFGT